MASATPALSAASGPAPSKRQKVVSANIDDFAAFGEAASRQVLMVKLPVDVAKIWRARFENGGVEFMRNTGTSDIEPRVELGMLMGDTTSFASGSILSLTGPDDQYLQYRVNLRPSTGMKMRVISAVVGPTGQNVKFEGEIAHQGQLLPTATDETYKALLKARVEANEVRAKVRAITQMEERTIISSQGRAIIRGSNPSKDDNDSGEEEEKVKKKTKPAKKPAADVAATKNPKKPPRKKERDLSDDAVKEALYKCFEKIDPETGEKKRYWKKKDLRTTTGIQLHKMQAILDQICDYHQGGPHDKTYSLKYTS